MCLTDSIKASFGDLFGDVNSGVDLYVSGVSEFGLSTPLIDEGLVDQVAALPGSSLLRRAWRDRRSSPHLHVRKGQARAPQTVSYRWQWTACSASPTFPTARISHHLR